MVHQTTASGFGGDNCKDVQHVVGRRHLSKQSEIHNRPAKIEEDERAVAIRFVEHSELHKLLPHHQSAYRSSHSTETAVLVRTMDSGNISALVLLDLSAAFDTVDHSIMLQVLRDRFCVEGRALEWFES